MPLPPRYAAGKATGAGPRGRARNHYKGSGLGEVIASPITERRTDQSKPKPQSNDTRELRVTANKHTPGGGIARAGQLGKGLRERYTEAA